MAPADIWMATVARRINGIHVTSDRSQKLFRRKPASRRKPPTSAGGIIAASRTGPSYRDAARRWDGMAGRGPRSS